MDRFTLQKEFYHLVKSLPEDDLPALQQPVEGFYVEKAIPYDDEPLTEEQLEEIMQGEQAIAAGQGVSQQEVMEKYGLYYHLFFRSSACSFPAGPPAGNMAIVTL